MVNPACVSVWDWLRRRQLSSFYNGNSKKATISSLQIINQDVGGMLLAGSGNVLLHWRFLYFE
jgi:regulatory associated protein of mTOR